MWRNSWNCQLVSNLCLICLISVVAVHLPARCCVVQAFCIINNRGTQEQLQRQTKWNVTTNYHDWHSHSQLNQTTLFWNIPPSQVCFEAIFILIWWGKKNPLITGKRWQNKNRQYLMGENIHGPPRALLSPTSVVLCIMLPWSYITKCERTI